MDRETRSALLDALLARAADEMGDLTRPVLDLFYAKFPAGRDAFLANAAGRLDHLEREMVDSTLYCMMHWIDRPQEFWIMFGQTVPHHQDALGVPPDLFIGLIDSMHHVIDATIPAEAGNERAVWREIRNGLADVVTNSVSLLA